MDDETSKNPENTGAKQIDLSAFTRVGVSLTDESRREELNERLYRPAEVFFGKAGPDLVNLGWSCFPQMRDGKRKPEKAGDEVIGWKQLKTRLPTPHEIRRWAAACPTSNVAIIAGPASGNSVAFDCDVMDHRLSWDLRQLAKRILGVHEWLRFGTMPKWLMLARLPECVEIASKSYRFNGADGNESDDAIEILYRKPFTAYGRHHKTGRYFGWPNGSFQPLLRPPSDLPVVTVEQIQEFIREAAKLRSFHKGGKAPGSHYPPNLAATFIEMGNVLSPAMHESETGEWMIKDDLVVDGRDPWLRTFCYSIAMAAENQQYIGTSNGFALMCEVAFVRARNMMLCDDKKGEKWLREQIPLKLRSTIDNIKSGAYKPWAPMAKNSRGMHERAVSHEMPSEKIDSLAWIGNTDVAEGLSGWGKKLRTLTPVLVPGAKEERALVTDRTEIAAGIQESIQKAIKAGFSDSHNCVDSVHLIPGGTGTGKSFAAINESVDDSIGCKRTKEIGPILFLSPTHANISELRKDAIARGAVFHDMPGYDTAPVKAVEYKGKIRAGCFRAKEVAKLHKAGIGTDGLCKFTGKDSMGNKVKKECPHYGYCPYQIQRTCAAQAQIVIAPHIYQTMASVPKELSKPRLVICDESQTFGLINAGFLLFSVLKIVRREYQPNKTEKKTPGFRAADVDEGRARACELALKAGNEKKDVAQYFFDRKEKKAIEYALKLCKGATTIVHKVRPDMTPEEFEILTHADERQYEDIYLEIRFWKLVLERYELLESDALAEQATQFEKDSGFVAGKRAKGDHDHALQVVEDLVGDDIVRSWRMSWRTEPNWTGSPHILLDASANEKITKVFYPNSKIVMHEMHAPPNMRVVVIPERSFSKSSLIPSGTYEDNPEKHDRSAQYVHDARTAIAVVAGRHGDGNVVVGSSKQVRSTLFGAWDEPYNVMECHYGAMRGLNAFKSCKAAVAIGRTEQSVRIVDAYVAALTYDTEPEPPLDALGTGATADNKPVGRIYQTRNLKMRTGHDVGISVPVMPTEWGRIVEEQWREEEIRQFIGRLRAIYRTDTPTAYLFTNCVPEDLVIDMISSLDDFLKSKHADILDELRYTGGVVDSTIMGCDMSSFISEKMDMPGWTKVDWKATDGKEHIALVASSWAEDAAERFREAFLHFCCGDAYVLEDFVSSVSAHEPNSPVAIIDKRVDAVSETHMSEDEKDELAMEFEERMSLEENAELNRNTARILFEREWIRERRDAES